MSGDLPVWLQPLARQLSDAGNGRGHAHLFVGPEGCGKRLLLRQVLRAWLPEGNEAHADVLVIRRLEGKRDITVDQIRELAHWTQQTAHGGHGRVVIIHALDSLNLAAANSLLKTLEEPPAGVRFLMTASRAGRLLPTILSRCQRWTLPLPGREVAGRWLATEVPTASEQDIDRALVLNAGGVFAARDWLQGEGLAGFRQWQGLWDQSARAGQLSQELVRWAREDAARLCRLLSAQALLLGREGQMPAWHLLRLSWQAQAMLQQNVNKDLLVDGLLQAALAVMQGQVPAMKLAARRGGLA